MLIENQGQFINSDLHERIDVLLADVDGGNGTPAAAIIKTVLAIDERISGNSYATYRFDTEEEIVYLSCEILGVLQTEYGRFELPFGTVITTEKLGNIFIGEEQWAFHADLPGLHRIKFVPSAARGSNLKLLHELILRKSRKLACRRLGLPNPVVVYDNIEHSLLQFPPFDEAGNVALQTWGNGTFAPHFCAAMPSQIEAFAEAIVADMRWFYKNRARISRQGAEMRAIAKSRVSGSDAEIDYIALNPAFQQHFPYLTFDVCYLATDVAMRRGRVLDQQLPLQPSAGISRFKCSKVFDLAATSDELRRHGADGYISQLVTSILASSHFDKAKIIETLSKSYDYKVALDANPSPIFVEIYWQSGLIDAQVYIPNTMILHESYCELAISCDLPETFKSTLQGSSISKLINLPFNYDASIERIENLERKLLIEFDISRKMINMQTGEIFD